MWGFSRRRSKPVSQKSLVDSGCAGVMKVVVGVLGCVGDQSAPVLALYELLFSPCFRSILLWFFGVLTLGLVISSLSGFCWVIWVQKWFEG